jgi:hypothetical protein
MIRSKYLCMLQMQSSNIISEAPSQITNVPVPRERVCPPPVGIELPGREPRVSYRSDGRGLTVPAALHMRAVRQGLTVRLRTVL